MSTSLRQRIVLGTTVALSTVVLIGSLAVWLGAHTLLYRTLDNRLRDQALATSRIPPGPPGDRQPGDRPPGNHRPRPEPDGRRPPPRPPRESPMPAEFSAEGGRSFFQIIERGSGAEVARSPSLPAGVMLRSLAPRPLPFDRPLTILLPDGRPLRLLAQRLGEGDQPLRLLPWLRPAVDGYPDSLADQPLDLLLAVEAGQTIADEQRLGWTLACLWLLTTAIGAVVAGWLQRAVLRPLDRLSHAITAIDPANLQARIVIADVPVEMLAVTARLNELLQRLEAAFTRERGTIANIAHELRTPVTGLLMTLELAQTSGGEPPAALATCQRIATAMQAMITNLLALARSEAGHAAPATHELDLVPLLTDCWSMLAARSTGQQQRIQWELPATCIATSNPDLLRMIATNLFDNAVAYTPAGGTISIGLRQDDLLQLTVRNDTDGTLRDCDQVFQPFWRGDAARTAGLHCGLGLALVAQLTTRLCGTVTAELDTRGGFVIRLQLPGR